MDEIVAPPPANPNEGLVDENDGLNDTHCYEQHFTEYDMPDLQLRDRLAKCGLPQKAYQQTFLSGNVSKTYTLKPQTNTTWYSYDVYGRVKWLVQMPHGMDCLKTIDYVYHPITGQVIEVDYQRHNIWERFIHRYTYNDAGQLTTVETSVDGNNFDHQATYIYNETGLLIRTELAENLQGIDYIYNLNGQLKAINHPSLSASNDPGNDGNNGFMADVFGMSIQYYQGDYARLSTPTPIANIGATTPNQFNGNIQAIQWQNQNGGASTYSYAYNKNNWLQEAKFNSPSTSAGDYNVDNLTYDANGNIKTLNRNGYTDASGNNAMDAFTYHYSVASNQLKTVEDRNDNTDPNRYNDLKNQAELGTVDLFGSPVYAVANDNYTYNDIGQLVINAQDRISYEYNANGLVTKVGELVSSNTNRFITLIDEDYEDAMCARNNWNIGFWFDKSPANSLRVAFADKPSQNENYRANESCLSGVEAYDLYIVEGIYQSDIFDKTVALPKYCEDFDTNNNIEYNNRHQINFYSSSSHPLFSNTPGHRATKTFNAIPNTYHELSLDLMLLLQQTQREPVDSSILQSAWQTTTEPIAITSATVEIIENFNDPMVTPTVLYTQDITAEANNVAFCNRSISHLTMPFTATTSKVKLVITIHNDNDDPPNYFPSSLAPMSKTYNKIYQTIEVDNVHLKVASKDKLAFYYDDRGHRIRKDVYGSSTNNYVTSTYYVRDASGSPMAIYTDRFAQTTNSNIILKEQPIYGASRLGIMYNEPKYREKGVYAYQLTDHLGNVRAVVMKSGSNALSLTSKTDYYPFGMPMPNRNVEGNYRYGYQGEYAEKDPETGLNAFEARLWDSRIGRWLTVDPAREFASPYLGMGNNPISTVDPDGRCTTCPDDWEIGKDFTDFEGNTFTMTKNGWATKGGYAGQLDTVMLTNAPQATITAKQNTWADDWATGNLFQRMGFDILNSISVTTQSLNPFDNQVDDLRGQNLNGTDRSEYGVNVAALLMPSPVKGTGALNGTLGIAANGTKNTLIALGRGSTGRTVANNLVEQMTMEAVVKNPSIGRVIMTGMKDTRWLGWSKLQYSVTTQDGVKAVVHFVGKFEHGVLKYVDDFKFK